MNIKKNLRVCTKGHKYFKSSDCPVCPICENEQKPKDGFISKITNPARSALEREDIKTLNKLSKYSKKEILQLHGIGPSAIPILREELNKAGFTFNKNYNYEK